MKNRKRLAVLMLALTLLSSTQAYALRPTQMMQSSVLTGKTVKPTTPSRFPAAPPETPAVPLETPAVPPETPAVPPETPAAPPETPDIPRDPLALGNSGFAGVTLFLSAPEPLPGEPVTVTARFEGVTEERICSAQWYLDGEALPDYHNEAFSLTSEQISTLVYSIPYSPQMPLVHRVSLVVTASNPLTGEEERLGETLPVTLQNYDGAFYQQHALEKVTTGYQPDMADYEPWEKEQFVNGAGYESKNEFLLWISLAAQKVNVFTGAQGQWKLVSAYPCAAGTEDTPTPTGVTTVSGKQDAWNFQFYTCKNIVRFYALNSGYAFHSRPLIPNTDTPYDETMGEPASHGCVRMLNEDIAWIHANIPVGTAVVIW